MTGAENFADAFGSTFWPSPQSWPWPPPEELDTLPYATTVSAAGVITAVSDPRRNPAAVTQRFRPTWSATPSSSVRNDQHGRRNGALGAVEITRMPAAGLAFWPSGGAPFGERHAGRERRRPPWCGPPKGPKARASCSPTAAAATWRMRSVATCSSSSSRSAGERDGPAEAEIELYVNAGHDYVESKIRAPTPPSRRAGAWLGSDLVAASCRRASRWRSAAQIWLHS